MVTDNLDKANTLNDQFSSVYTLDNDCIEHLPSLKVPNIQPLHIEAQGIYTLLSKLDPIKLLVLMVYHHDY